MAALRHPRIRRDPDPRQGELFVGLDLGDAPRSKPSVGQVFVAAVDRPLTSAPGGATAQILQFPRRVDCERVWPEAAPSIFSIMRGMRQTQRRARSATLFSSIRSEGLYDHVGAPPVSSRRAPSATSSKCDGHSSSPSRVRGPRSRVSVAEP